MSQPRLVFQRTRFSTSGSGDIDFQDTIGETVNLTSQRTRLKPLVLVRLGFELGVSTTRCKRVHFSRKPSSLAPHIKFYSLRQLTASDINFAVVRPLVFKYAKLDNLAIVYVCFVVRSRFLSEATNNLAYSGVNLSRANLCEIMAMKLLNHFASSPLTLISTLTASWSPLAGASPEVINEVKSIIGGGGQGLYDPQCALEVCSALSLRGHG